jgi:hypothetical protein
VRCIALPLSHSKGTVYSIGDDFLAKDSTKDSFLPDQTTRALAEQTNTTLQDAVRREGHAYVHHLDGFIVALREELDSPDGLHGRHQPAAERSPYRMDVKQDGTGVESPGWFSCSADAIIRSDDSMIVPRLCALQWVIVFYESVVPMSLKGDVSTASEHAFSVITLSLPSYIPFQYAREFVFAIIHQLVDNPPKIIVYKSLEVLATITIAVAGEDGGRSLSSPAFSGLAHPAWLGGASDGCNPQFPMTDSNVTYAFDILDQPRRHLMSRNREVFSALVQLHAYNVGLLADLSNVIAYMCRLQPPEFVFVSFAVELDRFMLRIESENKPDKHDKSIDDGVVMGHSLKFVSSFIQHMSHVLLNTEEAKPLRSLLQDCVSSQAISEYDRQKSRLFHILLHSFAHNPGATVSLCFWAGAYRTTTSFLNKIDPLDIDLMFFLEIDRFIEMLERPLFRHLHIRMLERDKDPTKEGSGSMLFQALKSLLMMLPQTTCYFVLRDRLTSVSRFRQSALTANQKHVQAKEETNIFLKRILDVRILHCTATWTTIRRESLETSSVLATKVNDEGASRRELLCYSSKKEDEDAQYNFRKAKKGSPGTAIEELKDEYIDLATASSTSNKGNELSPSTAPQVKVETDAEDVSNVDADAWKGYWADTAAETQR